MKRAANMTVVVLALVGTSFSQDVKGTAFPRGSLINRQDKPGDVPAATQKRLPMK